MKNFFNNEKGIVLPIVVVIIAIVTVLGFSAVFVVNSETNMIKRSAGARDAIYYAEAGVHKYLWHLNKDSTFYQTGTGTGLVPVEFYPNGYPRKYQPTAYEDGFYQLIIEPPQYIEDSAETEPFLTIISTGWTKSSPADRRTIKVKVQKRKFTQYGMVTNNEINEYGERLYWVSGEKFYGPLHSNDILYISGRPTFYGPVTYTGGIDGADKDNKNIFKQGAAQADPLTFPPGNSDLKAWATSPGGHYYNGRTCIMLRGDKYDVRTYDRDSGQWKYNGVPYRYKAGKYINELTNESYNNFSDFAAACPSLDLPENGVIYVDGETYDQRHADNHPFTYCWRPEYGNVFISGKLQGQLTVVAANDLFITGYNPTDWRNPRYSSLERTEGVTYEKTSFTQVMDDSGWLRTRVHVDAGYNGVDMLGLVAGFKIRILHYNWPAQKDPFYWGSRWIPIDVAPYNITIHAALYVPHSSYGFQYAEMGKRKGTITLVGSITQKYRGFVGSTGLIGGTGYKKVYSHDPRMKFDSPPHFTDPANSGWRSISWQEVAPP
ncbi:hypothetical protein JOC37_000443 [Desulfohalotomaculum tongense]|uniref:hypothetical protein n=1 Tax=Desulforadius tongensis TaxID=1216062 RepID=UPI001959F16A|nr:hypothetical protein [Desulforadius tongensis]MBM7854071.1 hypothetical protein [Desulforadius tongensis]